MIFDFLTLIFFIGLFVASLQDLKRREIDNWLNLTILLISFSYLFFISLFSRSYSYFFLGLFSLLIMSLVANLFYYGRVFAGGDAKLLFAMSALFVAENALFTLINIGSFILFLMISGSFYGIIFSFFLYLKNYKEVNKIFLKNLKKSKFSFFFLSSILFLIAGFYINKLIYIWAFVSIFLPFMYSFAKSLESKVMIKSLRGEELREGDWLLHDVKIGNTKIASNWEGLSKKELKILRKLKNVKIKEGIPFAPAFFIAYLLYIFFEKTLISFFPF